MSDKLNTTAIREMASFIANEKLRRKESPGAVLTGTVPGLCDEVDRLRATVERIEDLARRLDANGGVASPRALRNALSGRPVYAPDPTLAPCTTCMDEGWICYPHAEAQRIECPGEECGTCDYAHLGGE